MGDSILRCPLCCDKTFESKSKLIEHLAIILESITCPICSNKWSSLAHLIEHLTLDNCQAENPVPTISFDINTETEANLNEVENINENLENAQIIRIDNETQKDLSDPLPNPLQDNADDGTEMGRMYVEFLSKQLTKPCLQTQELKLVKDDGGISRYVFVTNDDEDGDAEMDVGSAIVTKQNNDGTISLTTVRDMKMESDVDPFINQENPEAEETQEEIYSCNTCGVSFTSVLDHIQSYHNDQDVVVEEPMEEMDTGTSEPVPVACHSQSELLPSEGTVPDKQMPRRMITETGDIVETPLVLKSSSISMESYDNLGTTIEKPQIKEELVDTKGRTVTRRYVVVDSVVKEIKQPEENTGPYHKVVIKEMMKANGEKLKVFNCMSCHVYVTSLDDFKSHPCKQLKYSCPHCPVSYDNSQSLCAHMKVHKVKPVIKEEEEFTCEICNTIFPTNKSLKLHKRMHDPVKARPIEPPVEGPHGLEVSSDKFLCSICNKLIPIDYRAVHQKSHKTKPELNCDICNKEFKSEGYLEMHMTVHLSDKQPANKQDGRTLPYTCLYCDRRFSRPHEKVKHERIHTGEKPHSCEICGKSFRVSYCLTLHMRTHTGARPYSCQHCGKRFKAHSVYNHHLLTHSEVRAYKCPYCPKAFKTSVQLAGHKNSHTKPFSCQQCNRPFASLYAVRMHQETHARQNGLKFCCSMCGASYARAFALKDHMKAVHDKETDKADIDKTYVESIKTKKDDSLITTIANNSEDWTVQNEDDNNTTEEIQIDSKSLHHEVHIHEEPIINSNFNELVVP